MELKSRISKYKIKKIFYYFCVDIDATKTAKITGLNRKTINRYFLLLRNAIFHHQIEQKKKFVGSIEVDESYFGAKRVWGRPGKLKRGRGTNKQPVFGIFERNGKVYTQIVADCSKRTLQDVILGKVNVASAIFSDGWPGYDGLVDVGFDKHFRVNHSKSFAEKDGKHINGIESFWSFTKRRLVKFNGVKKNFNLHLKECEWRWKRTTQPLFEELCGIFLIVNWSRAKII